MSSPTHKTVIAFDLYGTLLSTSSISHALAHHFGAPQAATIASLWRRYQLEYTWRLNSMGLYKPFSAITAASLRHALAESACTLPDDAAFDALLRAYDALETFPDVAPALQALAAEPDIEAYVFSNGTDAMVAESVRSSPSLAPYAGVFRGLVTVETVRCYKPDRRVYEHLAARVGKRSDGKGSEGEGMGSVWLVSGNPFDVVGARVAGLRAAWVDRAGGQHGVGGGWSDCLGELVGEHEEGGAVRPTIVVKGVDEAVEAIKKWTEEQGVGRGG